MLTQQTPIFGRPVEDADAEEVTVRRTVPVPTPLSQPYLDAHHAGTLTFRWLHNQVLAPIRADPVQSAAFQNFTNWIRVASTLGAGNAAAPVDMAYQAVFGFPAVSSRAPGVLAQHLPV